MPRRVRSGVVVAATAALAGAALVAPAASARSAHYVGAAPGSATCVFKLTVHLSPVLVTGSGGTNPSKAVGTLSHCSTTDSAVKISKGALSGSFPAASPPTCSSLNSLTTGVTFTIRWSGKVNGTIGTTTYAGKATFASSTLSSASERVATTPSNLQLVVPATAHGDSVTGSFAGGFSSTAPTNYSSHSLAAACDSKDTGGTGKGVKKVIVFGTATIGASVAGHIANAVQVATDSQQSFCAVLSSGGVRCWGANASGQLGDGTTNASSVALAVSGITTATAVVSDAADSFCARLGSGGVDCWGANTAGELGDGTTTASSVPVAVTGLSGAVAVTSDGDDSYCAVLSTGVVECWGANASGQLGNGSTTQSTTPVVVTGLTDATSVTSDGSASYCALLSTGAVACWGDGTYGELGDNSTARATEPVAVSDITDATAVSSDDDDSFCAVLSSGAVECWGANNFGQLGNATTTDSSVPVATSGISDAVQIWSDGDDSLCALLGTGSLQCFGANFSGELGDGTETASSVPVTVSDITNVTTVAGGSHATGDTEHAYCAVLSTGSVYCWGSNTYGELGDATTTDSSVPEQVVQP